MPVKSNGGLIGASGSPTASTAGGMRGISEAFTLDIGSRWPLSLGAGYVSGGYNSSATKNVDKFSFADDSRILLGAGLTTANCYLSSFVSSSAGYTAGGGNLVSTTATVEKLLFSNESRSSLTNSLSPGVDSQAGFSSSSSGYYAGGYNSSGYATVNEKILFSNDSISSMSIGLSRNGEFPASFSYIG